MMASWASGRVSFHHVPLWFSMQASHLVIQAGSPGACYQVSTPSSRKQERRGESLPFPFKGRSCTNTSFHTPWPKTWSMATPTFKGAQEISFAGQSPDQLNILSFCKRREQIRRPNGNLCPRSLAISRLRNTNFHSLFQVWNSVVCVESKDSSWRGSEV